MVLIAGAAVALIVVSAVITGILMTGKPEPKAAAAPKPTPVSIPTPAPQKVVVQVPVIALPPSLPSKPSPTPAPTAPPKPAETPRPIASTEPPQAASQHPAAALQSRNDLIQGIVDRFHISGVRSAGADSKALVDGHVYRVNDIMDRSVGLKLAKVESDHLTFVDADGNTYVKSF